MKKISALLLLVGLFYACNNQNKPAYKVPDFRTFDTAVYYKGLYVSEGYIKDIKKYKSPRLCQDSFSQAITIPDSTLKLTCFGVNFHEGGGSYVIVKRGNLYQLMDAMPNDSTHKINIDTLYRQDIEIISDNEIKIGQEYYGKIKSGNVIEEILFTGKYQSETGSTVEFTADGKVTGLENYKTYSVMIDYIDEARDVDQVLLGTNAKDQKEFAFKFKHDTLQIYELKCLEYYKDNHMCGSVDFGKLKYTLVKK
jgi:hypothetical protein